MSLDPRQARLDRALDVKPPARLEPPFPFKREPFDPFFFGADKQPDKEPDPAGPPVVLT